MRHFRSVTLVLSCVLLGACALTQKAGEMMGLEFKPKVAENKLSKIYDSVPPPAAGKITVAVYGFKDLTGQRKPSANFASFSSAVTQGAEPFLIKALEEVGQGQWFEVVERVGVDSLIKERTIIKQMREAYEGKSAQQLPPMTFAGMIIEGGIVGYDSGTESGGAAYSWLGIGPQTQYSKDIVTVSLRAVSVASGKVLASTVVTKTIYSTADSVAVLKVWKNGTQFFQSEAGLTINEPGTLAVKMTIEAAVVELLREGSKKKVWDFKNPFPEE
jgi:curli production assembly/transport component CsgG